MSKLDDAADVAALIHFREKAARVVAAGGTMVDLPTQEEADMFRAGFRAGNASVFSRCEDCKGEGARCDPCFCNLTARP